MSEYKLTLLYKKGLDYKTRNLIILIALLILTIVGSVLIVNSLKKRFVQLNVEKTKLQQELTDISREIQSEGPLRERLAELNEELFLTDSIMPDLNNSTITLAYIFDLFQQYRNNFFFNFRLLRSGQVDDDKEVHYNRYSVTGNAFINLLYVFIDQFERQPAFFTIESLELNTLTPEAEGRVNFNIEFNAYYTKTGTPYKDVPIRDLRERRLVYNLFYPRVYDPFVVDSEEFRELLDISEIVVIGFTQDRVFIRNRRTDMLEVLHVDDQIKHGKVQNIDWNNQEVVFRLNRTGISQEIRLPLQQQLNQ